MATLAELAEHGIVGSAYALPMPVREEPQGERLSIARIAEIQQRVDAATPGPWEEHAAYGENFYAYLGGPYLRGVGTLNFGDGDDAEADKALTVNAREDIRALLSELFTVRAELRVARGRVAELETDLAAKKQDTEAAVKGWERCRSSLRDAAEQIAGLESDLGGATARVTELEAGQENPLAFAEKLDAKSLDNFLIALASATEHEPQDAAIARIHELIASYRKEGVASVCRCGEPGVGPYVCEADDCSYDFPELNPFGGGPVHGHDAKVSRKCSHCGWHTSVWHVDDGSAEEELHGHIVRAHGSTEGGDAR
ncbi:hypothetical protein [Streptomyces werraensis]|uniref:hypothetical protein n=1 Tax=Streptomyces werraensis TaxID=68284 RepID=UPI0036921D41